MLEIFETRAERRLCAAAQGHQSASTAMSPPPSLPLMSVGQEGGKWLTVEATTGYHWSGLTGKLRFVSSKEKTSEKLLTVG